MTLEELAEKIREMVTAAVLAERTACIEIVQHYMPEWYCATDQDCGRSDFRDELVAAIRARPPLEAIFTRR